MFLYHSSRETFSEGELQASSLYCTVSASRHYTIVEDKSYTKTYKVELTPEVRLDFNPVNEEVIVTGLVYLSEVETEEGSSKVSAEEAEAIHRSLKGYGVLCFETINEVKSYLSSFDRVQVKDKYEFTSDFSKELFDNAVNDYFSKYINSYYSESVVREARWEVELYATYLSI